jgi:hypothetical protein
MLMSVFKNSLMFASFSAKIQWRTDGSGRSKDVHRRTVNGSGRRNWIGQTYEFERTSDGRVRTVGGSDVVPNPDPDCAPNPDLESVFILDPRCLILTRIRIGCLILILHERIRHLP